VISPLKAITNRLGTNTVVRYSPGSRAQFAQAADLAHQSDLALVFVGESSGEFNDRTGVSLSADLNDLVVTIAAANPRTVVVLSTSSAVLLPWADQVKGILQIWFGGQEVGNALADILFRDVNPSGRLPITFSRSATEFPIQTTAQFPGSATVSYSECLLIGYRWFDATDHDPLYAFGHGLSYTSFDYGKLSISPISPAGEVTVSCSVTNVGSRAGPEVVQLYLGMPASAGEPPRLLRGFQKLPLAPGESAPVQFVLKWEDLAVWSSSLHARTGVDTSKLPLSRVSREEAPMETV
jgi:beta-glucosidase